MILFLITTIFTVFSRTTCTDSFFIRQNHGRCLAFSQEQGLIFQSICRDRFRWQGGSRLIHVPTNKCLLPVSAAAGSVIGISDECSGTDSIWQYQEATRLIQHFTTGYCFMPQTAPAKENSSLIFDRECGKTANRFYFMSQAHFVIRYSSSTLCLVHDAAVGLFKIQDTYVCDRFEFKNSRILRHETGKCVVHDVAANAIKLTTNCTSQSSIFDLLANKLLYQPTVGKCVQPYGWGGNSGNKVVLAGCTVHSATAWKFYDDRYILKADMVSESCDDAASCYSAKGHITVNGYQYSFSTRGINTVVFDYRSGEFETRKVYDILASDSVKNQLATYLNGLPPGKILFMVVQDAVEINDFLATALQKYGVSATFATPHIPKLRISMATIAYTGSERKEWEASVNKVGGQGASILTKTIKMYRDLEVGECSEEMGLRTGQLPDSRFTAKSVYLNNPNFLPHFARLHNPTNSWCSAASALSDWLQIDLGVVKLISGLAIQPLIQRDIMHPVKRFYIQYSLDCTDWNTYNDIISGTRKEFVGCDNLVNDVRVNWFIRMPMRCIRIIPLERQTDLNTHCIRMELYGCEPKGPMFKHDKFRASPKYIQDAVDNQLSFYGISPPSKKATIRITTAATNATLANNPEQFHMFKFKAELRTKNGSIRNGYAKVIAIRAETAMIPLVVIELNTDEVAYHTLDFSTTERVLDAQLESGTVWSVISYETEDELAFFIYPMEIKRKSPDRSLLLLDVSKTQKSEFRNGDQIQLNTTIEHVAKNGQRSYANAYQLEMLVYYNTKFVTLQSVKNFPFNIKSLPPTRNETKPGLVHIFTENLKLLNSQFLIFDFKFNIPEAILKGTRCGGELLLEFKYRTNLKTFNGTWNTTLEKRIPYKCKVPKKTAAADTRHRLSLPEFSIAYDDINGDLVVCKRNQAAVSSGFASCYWQDNNNVTWVSLPYMATVVGIETAERALYGIEPTGKAYLKSDWKDRLSKQVEDSEWTGIQNQANVRKAKAASTIVSLPSNPSDTWMMPSTSKQVLTVTRQGVYRKIDGVWKRVFSL